MNVTNNSVLPPYNQIVGFVTVVYNLTSIKTIWSKEVLNENK